jgi:acetyl-CoA carboxylase biotin carboxyl carrier protein
MSKNLLDVITGNDVENLTTLIQKLEESSFNFLKLENQDFKIVIGKNGITESVEASNGNVQAATLTPVKPEPVQAPQHKEAAVTLEQPTQEVAPSKPDPVKDAAYEQEGIVTIKATTAGLFYAQPEPGAAPYVKVGDRVEENSTVGLIEIMKVYSAISAGVAGEITEIHVEDTQLVEYGQPLFSVKVK